MVNSEDIINHLFHKTSQGIKLGLHRMEEAAAHIDNPQTTYPSFHIAGTNGKGSTCAYLESIVRSHGYKTALFTSPHIKRFEERFIINGKPVATRRWMDVYGDLAPIIEQTKLTFFEAVTLMAFELFKRENVGWAVLETGLGGRLDATNIVTPKVSVITAIAMDHQHYLGNDLESIAKEKLGIVKQGVPLVIVKPSQPQIRELVKDRCASTQSQCFMVSVSDAAELSNNGQELCFTNNGKKYETSLHGGYQIVNALTALKAACVAGLTNDKALVDGIARTVVPGRFQIVRMHNRFVVFDVGHNPHAAESFAAAVRSHFDGLQVCIVTGIMKDKDCAGILDYYCTVASRIIFTQPKTERSAAPQYLASLLPAHYSGKSQCIADVDRAVSTALEGKEKVICVAGSFFTVGEAMTALGVEPYGNG